MIPRFSAALFPIFVFETNNGRGKYYDFIFIFWNRDQQLVSETNLVFMHIYNAVGIAVAFWMFVWMNGFLAGVLG